MWAGLNGWVIWWELWTFLCFPILFRRACGHVGYIWDVGLMVGLWAIVFLVLDHLSSHISTNTI